MNKTLLAVLVPLAWAAHAQDAKPGATTLKEVTVTATRVETDADTVPATITTLERKTLAQRAPRDEADLFRDEPDVALARDLRRFGATRVNIRGLEDGRVVQMVDGVRLSDFYNGGGPTNFSQTGPLPTMTDFLKRVEILRGPASALYGSDAIGGVVGYLTLDPADLLRGDAHSGYQYRLGYHGVNQAVSHTVLGAWRGAGVQALLGLSQVRAKDTANQGEVDTTGSSRSQPNPQDSQDRGLLAKFTIKPAPGHTLGLTLEGRQQAASTDVRRLSASLPRVASMQGEDDSSRLRASLDWTHVAAMGWYDRLNAKLHAQDSQTDNRNTQQRRQTSATCAAALRAGAAAGVAPNNNSCHIEQLFSFGQRAYGAGVQLDKAVDGGAVSQFWSYGADVSRVETRELRDAWVWNLTTGGVPGSTPAGKSLAGDSFPLRDFAVGQTDSVGLFAQGELRGVLDERLSLTPALRYDWRKLTPKVDALAQAVLDANKKQVMAQSSGGFSPKLAALWRFSPGVAGWAQVARGFRAPNYDELNGNFRNTAQSYGIAPNPDLKPETSVGLELGLRARQGSLGTQVSVYDNRYRDFIASVRLDCPSDPRCIAGLASTSLAQNLSRVSIRGAEARANWDAGSGWRVDGALAWAEGTNQSTGQPLNSIEPLRVSMGLAHDAGNWGAEARVRGAAAKTRTDDSNGVWFHPPKYAVADVSAWWQVHARLRLTAAVGNLFDRKYWLWSDIRQADATNPVGVDFYSQPGRNVSLAFRLDI